MGRRPPAVHGVLVVDKPKGPTSHDVVARARKALGTGSIGHAGTLDPMATGVLVLGVGEGTKLLRWLVADDKAYQAAVSLGAETDTLDAEGAVTERAPVPPLDRARVEAVAARFVGTYAQHPPAYSAIKVGGEALYEKARRGETVEVEAREVTVRRLAIESVEADRIALAVECAKGFYVRSLARDLARALETRGHLVALRRTQSGAFTLADAVEMDAIERAASGDEGARVALRARLLPLADACREMPKVVLDARALEDARHGRPVRAEAPPGDGPLALVSTDGALVAIAERRGERLQVLRGVR